MPERTASAVKRFVILPLRRFAPAGKVVPVLLQQNLFLAQWQEDL